MISLFRKYLTSWFALGLLGLVLVAFAVTGIGNPFATAGAGAAGTVARVGDTDLTEARLLAEFDRVLRRARQENPKLTAPDAARQGAVGEVLEQLIATTALEEFGRDIGVAVSERAVDGEIASVEAFRVGGKFDPATYRRLLAEQRIGETELRDGLRGDLIRKQVVTPVIAGSQVPRAMAAPYAALLVERREGAIAVVPAAAMPAPPAPTDTQLTAYFTANAARYTTPERRAFRYASIDRDKIAAGVAITDADVARYFADNKESFGGIETRRLAQVVVPDRARADALVTAIRSGQSFAAAAAAAGFAGADTDLGQLTQAKFASATSAEVAAVAFAVPAGGITAPVQSPFGWHVVEAVAVTAAKPRGLAEARGEILTRLRAERGEQALADTVGKIEDALAASSSFADVAKTYGLTIASVPALTRDGRDPDVSGYVPPPAVAPLVAKAFDSDPADGAVLQQLGPDQFAVLEVGDVIAPALVPLAKVRAEVATAWTADQRLRAAKTATDAVVAAVAKGTPLDAALGARKLPPARPLTGRRIDLAQQAQVPPPVQLFLTLGAKGVRAIPAPQGQGYWIVRVATVTPGDVASVPQLVDSARQQFAESAPDELGRAFAQAVERERGVRRNPEALAAATARIMGDAPAAK